MRSGFSKETDSKLGVVNLYHLQVNYRFLFKVTKCTCMYNIYKAWFTQAEATEAETRIPTF